MGSFGGINWGGAVSTPGGQVPSATLSTVAPVLWANGSPFTGWLLIGIAMPTGAAGSSYPSATLWGQSPAQPLPQWIMVPIIAGSIDTYTSIFYNTYLDPPGCRYVAYWLDSNRNQIYPALNVAPLLFDITSSPYTITQPTLTAPSSPNNIPAPQGSNSVASSLSTQTYAFPSQETPLGTVDGSNAVFTLSRAPNFLIFMVDGQVQDPTTYTVANTTVTLNVAPTLGAAVRAIVF